MRKILALALLLAFPASALAVDNTLLITPCAAGCITTKSKDVGSGVQAPQPIISDTAGAPIYGTAGTANVNVLTVQGIASMTPLIVTNSGTFAVQAAQAGTWNVTNISGTVSLPTGAATAANQGLLTTWGGGTLGAMANYGTSPGAVLVPGVNSFITNVPAVSQSGTWNITNVSGTVSLPTGAATAANQATEISSLATIATNTGAAIPAGTANIGNVGQISQYPTGATPITASATGTTAATTATLAANVSLKTFLCSMSIRANATAAVTGNATVTGTVTGTLNFTQWTAPAASGLGVTEMIFSPCVPSSAINTAIAVVSAAPGTGGVVSVTATGYQL